MKIKREIEDRAHIIGCSSIGKWLRVSTYATQYDAYLEYIGEKPEPAPEQQERLDMGHALEDFIAHQAEKKYGVRLRCSNYAYCDPERPWLICHPDRLASGLVDGKRVAVEIKSSSAFDSRWGDEGSDEIPMDYLCQCQGYFICTVPCDEVWLIRFSNNRLTRYIIREDRELQETIISSLTSIVDRLSSGWKPDPDTFEEAAKVFSAVEEGTEKEADESIMKRAEKLHEIDGLIKELETEKDSIKAEIVSYLSGASILTYGGRRIAKYLRVDTERFDSKSFRIDHPELYQAYMKQSSYMKLS